MNLLDARRILLVRAFESPLHAPWTEADRDAVTREAARLEGAAADAAPFIARRAALAFERLHARDAAVRAAWAASAVPAGIGAATLALAAAAGASLDAVASADRIDLLAPPLLGLLVWNGVVYLGLAWQTLRGGRAAAPLRRLAVQAAARLAAWRAAPSPPLGRFLADWQVASTPWRSARLAAWLHGAAAAFAAGALASLYLRGLAFEFRAGWQSTFLDAAAVQRLLAVVLAPGAWLSGLAVPGVDQIAALRGPSAGGENAARWMHLWAATIAVAVLLPRALLGAWAARRSATLDEAVELPLHEPYFQRLLPQGTAASLAVAVWPFNCDAPAHAGDAFAQTLSQALGRNAHATLHARIDEGEDGRVSVASGTSTLAALFAAGATPELETHGAFLRRLQAQAAPGARVLALVDASAFRRRFTGNEGATRLAQRRQAWQALADELGIELIFAELDPTGSRA